MSCFSTLQNKITLLVILSISCSAHAEIPAKSKPQAIIPPWELYDTDKNDYISAEEATAQGLPPETFNALDIDRDGRLNKEEFSKVPPIQSN